MITLMEKIFLVVFTVFILSSMFIAGLSIGWDIQGEKLKAEAVKRGFAEYDSKTGKWQWKQENIEK